MSWGTGKLFYFCFNNNQNIILIVFVTLRPLYCIKEGDGSCDQTTLERVDLRQGFHLHSQSEREFALEPLFYKYGVGNIQKHNLFCIVLYLLFSLDIHFYVLMLPMFNNTVMGGADNHDAYNRPKAPIDITTGSDGNREKHASYNKHLRSWVAAKDKHHVVLEQTLDDQGKKVIDKVDIIKHGDKPF